MNPAPARPVAPPMGNPSVSDTFEIEDMYEVDLRIPPSTVQQIRDALALVPALKDAPVETFVFYSIAYALKNVGESFPHIEDCR